MSESPPGNADHHEARLPLRAAFLGLSLLALGFVVGYGFHTVQSEQNVAPPLNVVPTPQAAPPIVKGLRVSPDGKKLAFSAVSSKSERAHRFVFDVESKKFRALATPLGWQDYIVQWSADGSKILFDRERIPRVVAEATGGLHEARIEKNFSTQSESQSAAPSTAEPPADDARALTPKGTLPPNEKSVAGFWTPRGNLIVKTRREPKFLYEIRDGRSVSIDSAGVTYFQNRAVSENGKTIFFIVRDLPNQPKSAALFRIENGRSRQLSAAFAVPEWVYVAENGRWMIVCRDAPNEQDWQWTLYQIAPQKASVVSTRVVPGDISGVFWSPDRKRVLGASGESLWVVDIPSLQSRRLGSRTDWNADDAGWLPDSKTVIVASKGTLWRMDAVSGAAQELWNFPAEYWN